MPTFFKMVYPHRKEVTLRWLLYCYKKLKHEKPHWFDGHVRINSLFPPYPSESYNRFMNILLKKKRIPHTVYLAVTSHCPYTCPHCSYGKRQKKDASTEKMIEVIHQIKELGTAIIGFTGGEPLLRKDLPHLIQEAGPECTTVVFTTGYKLTENYAKKLAAANVGCVTIGIESSCPEIHDNIRGVKGSFIKAEKAVKHCLNAGIFTAIGTVAIRKRLLLGELDRIYALGKRWGVHEMRLITPVATGSWTKNTREILNKEELEMLKEFHIHHNKNKDGPVMATFAYFESAELFGCNAGFQNLYIDASGEICPCDLTPLSFGNAFEKPLKDIWIEMKTYFPRQRLHCLMNTIAPKIHQEKLPLTPDQSKKLIPAIDKKTQLPGIVKYLKKNKS